MAIQDDLFGDDDLQTRPKPSGPKVPFAQYLRETPPAPLSQGTKLALWAAGVLTALLFLASLLKIAV